MKDIYAFVKFHNRQGYSNDSYMQARGNVRQGFGGNYKRNTSSGEASKTPSPPAQASPPAQPSPPTQPPFTSEQPQYPPRSTMATDPPPMETVVKVATVMTVTKQLPPAEQKVQIEQGPRVTSPTAELQLGSLGSHGNHTLLGQQDAEETQSPSVRARLNAFQSQQPYTPPRIRPLNPGMPMSRSKVKELKESLLRSSNENLNKIDSERVSPGHSLENVASAAKQNSSQHEQPVVPSGYKERTEQVASARLHQNGDTQSDAQPARTQDGPMRSRRLSDRSQEPPIAADHPRRSELTNGGSPGREDSPEQQSAPPRLHQRQKSQEEIDYEKQAALVAQRLKDEDKHLSEVIQPPPDHKTATDFMVGIFDTKVDTERRPCLLHKSASTSAMRRRSNASPDRRLNSSLPSGASSGWSPLSAGDAIYIQGTSIPLDQQKQELRCRIERKLEILRDEKLNIEDETDTNRLLGAEVSAVVESKCQNQAELDKYRLYVDELEKVMILLLKLSGRLARAQNAVLSLSEDAPAKQRTMLEATRDQIREKHEDAKSLKEGIDRRSKAVAGYLRRYLTPDEFADYEHFIKMKSKLAMETQEIEDQIRLGEEQLKELQKSMTSSQS